MNVRLVKTESGKLFDAFQWHGERDENLPAWLRDLPIVEDNFHGDLLLVGHYRVRTGRYVLRSHERGDIFPVPVDMFDNTYTEAAPMPNTTYHPMDDES